MKALLILKEIIENLINIIKVILRAAIPVAAIMVACDIILGTTFNVLNRLQSILSMLGLSGNLLTVLIIVCLVVWYGDRKKV